MFLMEHPPNNILAFSQTNHRKGRCYVANSVLCSGLLLLSPIILYLLGWVALSFSN